jgi:hypothetical protein
MTRRLKLSVLLKIILGIFVLVYLKSDEKDSRPLTCGRYPRKSEISYDNEVWQLLETSNGSVFLLNAYLDERWERKVVKINAIAPELSKNERFFCQFWLDEATAPFVTETTEFQTQWFKSK